MGGSAARPEQRRFGVGASDDQEKTNEELVSEAQRLYEERLNAMLEPEHIGEYVAIDLDTGGHAVAKDPIAAYDELLLAGNTAPFVLLRVGFKATFEMYGGQ
jgi:hypothetical protein